MNVSACFLECFQSYVFNVLHLTVNKAENKVKFILRKIEMEVELDCTSSCKLVKHGNEITKVLTKHEIDEDKLIKYLICTCKNFSTSKDLNVSRKML